MILQSALLSVVESPRWKLSQMLPRHTLLVCLFMVWKVTASRFAQSWKNISSACYFTRKVSSDYLVRRGMTQSLASSFHSASIKNGSGWPVILSVSALEPQMRAGRLHVVHMLKVGCMLFARERICSCSSLAEALSMSRDEEIRLVFEGFQHVFLRRISVPLYDVMRIFVFFLCWSICCTSYSIASISSSYSVFLFLAGRR